MSTDVEAVGFGSATIKTLWRLTRIFFKIKNTTFTVLTESYMIYLYRFSHKALCVHVQNGKSKRGKLYNIQNFERSRHISTKRKCVSGYIKLE